MSEGQIVMFRPHLYGLLHKGLKYTLTVGSSIQNAPMVPMRPLMLPAPVAVETGLPRSSAVQVSCKGTAGLNPDATFNQTGTGRATWTRDDRTSHYGM